MLAGIKTVVEIHPVIRYSEIRLRLSSTCPPHAMRKTTPVTYPCTSPSNTPWPIYINVPVVGASASSLSNVDRTYLTMSENACA